MSDLILHEDKPLVAASNSIIEGIMMLAKDKDFDAGKLKLMQEMFFTQEDRNREAAFARDFVACQGELPKIPKRGFNQHTKSKYEYLDDIIDLITPTMSAHGFGLSFGAYEPETVGNIGASATLFHKDGHSKEIKYECPLDAVGINSSRNKTDVHAKASAMQYARRYLTRMIWNLSTGDDDDGNAAGGRIVQKITEQQAADLDALINEVGAKRDAFMSYFKIQSLTDLPAISYNKAVKLLIDKRKKD